jgi:hypothetical protein
LKNNIQKKLQIKEQYYVPPQYKTKVQEHSEKLRSLDTTKHSSANDNNHNNDDSDVYGLNNRRSSKLKKKKIRGNDTLTQGSEDEKQHEIDPQKMTFKKYREEILNKKNKNKKQIKLQQKLLIERKNSSNGSIQGMYF